MTIDHVHWAPVFPDPWATPMVSQREALPRVDKPRGLYVRFVKPIFDRALALGALAVAAIPMALIAASVGLSMGRPVLFRQRRIGRDGEPFEVIKFRTMLPDRRGQRLDVIHDRRRTHKSHDDPRHTAVGRVLRKYSLDELPQLFNVLRGEMSLVGPRPELDSVVELYPQELHQRHYVRPGLTGLWQVSARRKRANGGKRRVGPRLRGPRVLRTDLQIIAKTPRALVGQHSGS